MRLSEDFEVLMNGEVTVTAPCGHSIKTLTIGEAVAYVTKNTKKKQGFIWRGGRIWHESRDCGGLK